MANRSTFPAQIDTFVEHFDITSSDINSVKRFQELKLKTNRTLAEENELSQLTTSLRSKIISPEDFNKFQDALVNMEVFIRDNVEGYITTKQGEFDASLNTKTNELTTIKNDFSSFVSTKTTEITNHANSKTVEMTEKKDYFVNYVNTKEDEVRKLVQEFDSNSARYYQSWSATAGQTVFNIYNGQQTGTVPADAKLDFDERNIDLIVNGTVLAPYVDYRIVPDGVYDKIELLGGVTLSAGTEVVAKWYKNVGKLYFTHASQHGEGGTDPIKVTEGMIDAPVKARIPKIQSTAPTSPSVNQIWIDTSV